MLEILIVKTNIVMFFSCILARTTSDLEKKHSSFQQYELYFQMNGIEESSSFKQSENLTFFNRIDREAGGKKITM